MMQKGLVAECEDLVRRGYDFELPALNSVGYKQIGNYLKGQSTYEQAVQETKYETHRLVRHQYAWFRLTDRRIHWFDTGSEIAPEVMRLLADRLDPAW
jgi:tRNA dimethylallyltransferase